MNFPDMHRVRMSLPYFKKFGWEPEVVCVDENYVEGFKDILLNSTVPPDILIHKIKAAPAAITKRFHHLCTEEISDYCVSKSCNAFCEG